MKQFVLAVVLGLATASSASAQAIVVDHTSVVLFEAIPPAYLTLARNLSALFRTASVGQNIRTGKDCLANNTPNYCRTGFGVASSLVPIILRPQYASPNWLMEFRGNPGWYGKVTDFVTHVNERHRDFKVMMYKQSYVDDPTISRFWDLSRPPGIGSLEALEAAYPSVDFVYWTAAVAKSDIAHINAFNTRMRTYAIGTQRHLFDLADIETHRPDGSSCGTTICPEYNNEISGGHLSNGMAQQRVAKAFWVLMARLAGWVPGSVGGDTEPPSVSNFVCALVLSSLTCSATVTDNAVVLPGVSVVMTAQDAAGNATTASATTVIP